MIKELAVLGIVATAGGLSICPLCGARATTGSSAAAAHLTAFPIAAPLPATSVVTLKITGMTCGGCVIGVRKVLTKLDGVTTADVSYEKGNAIVRFDPSKVSTAQMIAAIKTLGYSAIVAS